MTDRFGTDVATRKEQIEGTWTVDGEEYALLTEDTTKETLELIEDYMALAEEISQAESPDDIPEDAGEDLPDFPWEDEDDDKDIVESVVGAKLIKPDVDPQQTPVRKLRALFQGMMEAWTEGKQVKERRV